MARIKTEHRQSLTRALTAHTYTQKLQKKLEKIKKKKKKKKKKNQSNLATLISCKNIGCLE